MKLSLYASIVISIVLSACQNENARKVINASKMTSEISFYTSDSIRIIGDLYSFDKKNTTILLFHQGGSNARGEYAPIIPKLVEKGFNVLAIDQRMGGQVYGSFNRTLSHIPTNNFEDGYTYCDAYNNIEGALDFIIKSGFTGKKILWGSSYSASLAIQLASKRQRDINGVLAFSPTAGNSMKACPAINYFEEIKIPLILLRPPNEMKNPNSKNQFDLAIKNNHRTYVVKHGVHGSSMLVESRVKNEINDNWNIVLSFIDEIENNSIL
jgi:pimeloyl-ACP methyl ester carboxylesterase